MADTIQEFLIALGFKVDPAQQSRFVDALKVSHDHIQRVGRGMSDILNQFAALATAATGAGIGLAAALNTIGKNMSDLGFAAERIKSSPETIRALEYALKQMGGTAEDARASLEAVASAQRLQPGLLETFGVKEGAGTVEAFLQLGQRWQEMTARGAAGMSQAVQEAARIHVSEQNMLRLANPQTRQFYGEEIDRQQRTGLNMPNITAIGTETTRGINRLEQTFSDFTLFLEEQWGPRYNKALTVINDWFKEHTPQITGYLTQTQKNFDGVTDSIGRWWTSLQPATQDTLSKTAVFAGGALAVTQIGTLIGLIGRVVGLGALAGPIGMLASLAGGILLLANDYKTWQESGGKDSLIDWTKWEPAITAATDALKFFNEQIIQPLAKTLGVGGTFIPAFAALALFLAGPWTKLITGPIKWLLTALAMIPGSGITAAMLSPLGIAVGAGAAVGAVGALNDQQNANMEEAAKAQGFEKQGGSWWNPFNKMPTYTNPKTGETLTFAQMQERLGMRGSADEMGQNNPVRDWWKDKAPSWLGGGEPRGIRNKNPLNLSGAGTAGLEPQGRFGVYNTMEEGVDAARKQLERYQDVYGLDTVAGIINRWAPPSENDTAGYAKRVAAALNVGVNDKINTHDPATMQKLIAAMAKTESRALDPAVIERGLAMKRGGQLQTAMPKIDFGGMVRNSGIADVSKPPDLGGASLVPAPSAYNQSSTDQSKEVNVTAPTNITINGVSDPERAAALTERSQERQSANLLRHLQGVYA